ncbi:MAG: AAA family ATPase [Methyloprofundus sp.]|nr:AAA family ATPase [Methyloprofundus sp.]
MTPHIDLSPKQQEIVFAENGAIYVKASAGSGKTRILTERIRYLLGNTNKKILALTFTNKAGAEIKERLSDISEIEKRVFIGTFHGFCQSILENHGHSIGLTKMPHIFEEEADRLELIEQAINQTPSYAGTYKTQSSKEQKNFRYRVLNYISKVKRELIADNELEQHTDDENIVLLYQNYQDILRAQNAIDFDDLLLLAYSLLVNYPKTAALYRRSFFAICIDEAQDLNNAQYQFLRALANGEFKNIMMVGDPNQSIFHFNGSSPDYMDKHFVHDFSPSVFELNENYRSSLAILEAARKIIPDVENITETVKAGIFEIKALEDEGDEARWIINKITSLVSLKKHEDIEGDISYEKIAVLARNKYIFNQLEAQLVENKLPFYYKMTPGTIRFESDLMKIFDLGLRARLNSQDILHKKRLLNRLKIEDSNVNLENIVPLILDPSMKKVIILVVELNDDGSNLKRNFESLKDNINIEDENEKNMIINDINELLKHWHNYARKTDNKSLHQFKNAMALGQTHPLAQHSGITLSTVHTMKGQEFDIVFIMGMDNDTFPDYRAVRNGGIELKQEKNNLYVAFTRAKRFLYVTYPEKRMMPWGDYKTRNISRFLKGF